MESVVIDVYLLASQRNWKVIQDALAGDISSWRRGLLPLTRVLKRLPGASFYSRSPCELRIDRSLKHRLQDALSNGRLRVVEMYNRTPDIYAAERAMLFAVQNQLLSSIFIGK